jgi:hypothetical protein
MMHVKDLFDLTIEEGAELARFEHEINRLLLATEQVISETEISKIEATLTDIIEEIVESGRQQTNKSNA